MSQRYLLPIAIFFFAASALAAERVELSPDQPSVVNRANPVTYDVDFSVVVTPPYHTHVLKVWLPIPQNDDGQVVTPGTLSSFPLEVEPKIASEPLYGNKFAYFEFHEPQGAQIIRHQFRVKTWELRWNLEADKVVAVGKWPESFDKYRRGESQAVQVDDRFHKLLAEIVPQSRGPLSDLSSVMFWADKNFQYDHHDASLRADSARMIEAGRGHCSDFHGFCAAMGRALGYPTRVAYGINPFPKNSPSHCKLEAFIPPYGWVSFDVSETQKLGQAIAKDAKLSPEDKQRLQASARQRLVSGFRDNSWFCMTRGTDYDLVPPASTRVPVVRTAYIEADGKPLPDPDPADPQNREFGWMTVHKYVADKEVPYPFKEFQTLNPEP